MRRVAKRGRAVRTRTTASTVARWPDSRHDRRASQQAVEQARLADVGLPTRRTGLVPRVVLLRARRQHVPIRPKVPPSACMPDTTNGSPSTREWKTEESPSRRVDFVRAQLHGPGARAAVARATRHLGERPRATTRRIGRFWSAREAGSRRDHRTAFAVQVPAVSTRANRLHPSSPRAEPSRVTRRIVRDRLSASEHRFTRVDFTTF